jgi:hypothetical protein
MSSYYQVVVRNQNSWTQNEDGSNREHEIIAVCGHKHKMIVDARACMNDLKAWYCTCGERSDSRRRCTSNMGHHTRNSTSSLWYRAGVEVGEDSDVLPCR